MLAVLAVLGAALGAWLFYGPRRTPEGQPPLVALDASSLDLLRQDFNAHPDHVRILAMLSPT